MNGVVMSNVNGGRDTLVDNDYIRRREPSAQSDDDDELAHDDDGEDKPLTGNNAKQQNTQSTINSAQTVRIIVVGILTFLTGLLIGACIIGYDSNTTNTRHHVTDAELYRYAVNRNAFRAQVLPPDIITSQTPSNTRECSVRYVDNGNWDAPCTDIVQKIEAVLAGRGTKWRQIRSALNVGRYTIMAQDICVKRDNAHQILTFDALTKEGMKMFDHSIADENEQRNQYWASVQRLNPVNVFSISDKEMPKTTPYISGVTFIDLTDAADIAVEMNELICHSISAINDEGLSRLGAWMNVYGPYNEFSAIMRHMVLEAALRKRTPTITQLHYSDSMNALTETVCFEHAIISRPDACAASQGKLLPAAHNTTWKDIRKHLLKRLQLRTTLTTQTVSSLKPSTSASTTPISAARLSSLATKHSCVKNVLIYDRSDAASRRMINAVEFAAEYAFNPCLNVRVITSLPDSAVLTADIINKADVLIMPHDPAIHTSIFLADNAYLFEVGGSSSSYDLEYLPYLPHHYTWIKDNLSYADYDPYYDKYGDNINDRSFIVLHEAVKKMWDIFHPDICRCRIQNG